MTSVRSSIGSKLAKSQTSAMACSDTSSIATAGAPEALSRKEARKDEKGWHRDRRGGVEGEPVCYLVGSKKVRVRQ